MNFFHFFVVQNSKSETKRNLAGSLLTQLDVHNHWSILSPRCSLLICPNFKVGLRQAFKKNGATELIVVTKLIVL